MQKTRTLSKICQTGVVVVVRATGVDQAKRIAEACMAGGLNIIEITFTVPGAHTVLENLSHSYSAEELVLGAGTVLDAETARIAILNGAQYVVTPYLNKDAIQLCNRYQIPVMPGAMTVKEVVEGMEAGADIIKIFPGEVFGPKLIKAIKGPIPQANLMPTGGVSLENVHEWFEAGALAVGVGGNLTESAKHGDYVAITEKAKQFVQRVQSINGC